MSRINKYLDADRTIVNPQWLEQQEQARAALAADPWAYGLDGTEAAQYLPEVDDKLIDPEGAWILVLEEPNTELRQRFRVPLLSMWRARPTTMGKAPRSFLVDGVKITLRPQQAVIATPGGDLHLWPHEYSLAVNPKRLACDPLATLHSLDSDPVIDPEQLFYLTSRGIPRHEATLMLFDQVTNTDFCYVTFPDDVAAALTGVGTSRLERTSL